MNEPLYRELRPFLSLEKGILPKMHWKTMNYAQLDRLGIFEQRDIWQILRERRAPGKAKFWDEIVVQFDLTEGQAHILKQRTDIQ